MNHIPQAKTWSGRVVAAVGAAVLVTGGLVTIREHLVSLFKPAVVQESPVAEKLVAPLTFSIRDARTFGPNRITREQFTLIVEFVVDKDGDASSLCTGQLSIADSDFKPGRTVGDGNQNVVQLKQGHVSKTATLTFYVDTVQYADAAQFRLYCGEMSSAWVDLSVRPLPRL
jgi:hypothetical protein